MFAVQRTADRDGLLLPGGLLLFVASLRLEENRIIFVSLLSRTLDPLLCRFVLKLIHEFVNYNSLSVVAVTIVDLKSIYKCL